jgi:hypothetical protein
MTAVRAISKGIEISWHASATFFQPAEQDFVDTGKGKEHAQVSAPRKSAFAKRT